MVEIRDSDGNKLGNFVQLSPMLAMTAAGALVQIEASIVQTNQDLPDRYVSAAIDWNDGKPVQSLGPVMGGELEVNETRLLLPGDYSIALEAAGYGAPGGSEASVSFGIKITSPQSRPEPIRVIFGPILPRDEGFPNARQWAFDIESDLLVLASSIKMLLMTVKGERIMEPEYGTNLHLILFESNTAGIEGIVRQEIVDSISKWEPRVTLQFLEIERARTQVNVQTVFESRLDRKTFGVPLLFSPS